MDLGLNKMPWWGPRALYVVRGARARLVGR